MAGARSAKWPTPTEPRSDALQRAMHDVEPHQAVGRVVEGRGDGGQRLEAERAPEGDGARVALDDAVELDRPVAVRAGLVEHTLAERAAGAAAACGRIDHEA